MHAARYYPLGDTAMTVELGRVIDASIQADTRALDRRITAAAPKGLLESVPSYASITLFFDPALTDASELQSAVETLTSDNRGDTTATRRWRVPACYEDDCGEDLAEAADVLGMSTNTLIAAHTATEFEIALYGFAPGWAYLSGCPETIAPPRRATPRAPTPPDALMIAGGQALLTAQPMPTGWYVIGRAAQPALNLHVHPPVCFEVGDKIQFEAVDRATWAALYQRAQTGDFVAEALS